MNFQTARLNIQLSILFLALTAVAMFAAGRQSGTLQPNSRPSHTSKLVVRVIASDGDSFADLADVSISSHGDALHKSTDNAKQAIFESLAPGTYYVLVTAPGYKPGADKVTVDDSGTDRESLIRLDPLTSAADAMNTLRAEAVVKKIQKDVSQGIADLQSGKWNAAGKKFKVAYKVAPDDPGLDYLYGYVFLHGGDLTNAEDLLLRAASINPQNDAAFVALGELRLKQGDLPDAAVMFEQGVSLNADNWSAHWSLAETYLKLQQFDKAESEADAAVTTGKGAADGAQFIVGEAWAGLGDSAKAIATLESFIEKMPKDPSAPTAQALLANLKDQQTNAQNIQAIAKAELANATSSASGIKRKGVIPPIDAAISAPNAMPDFALPVWAPAGVDEVKPAVTPGASCWLPYVVQRTGTNIVNLVTNISNIDAKERMVYEELGDSGDAVETLEHKYDYMASFDEIRPGNLTMDELRDQQRGLNIFPGDIEPTGLTSMALVFHPYLRDDFQMTCEGLGAWHGRPAWIIYFRQRDGLPGRISGYTLGGHTHTLALKGRAWITKDTYQVMHIETDLVRPMPEIQLMLQHLSVDYTPVQFRSVQEFIWLPSTADMYFEFRKKRLHARDIFTSYKLFSTSASQHINNPTIVAPDINSPTDK